LCPGVKSKYRQLFCPSVGTCSCANRRRRSLLAADSGRQVWRAPRQIFVWFGPRIEPPPKARPEQLDGTLANHALHAGRTGMSSDGAICYGKNGPQTLSKVNDIYRELAHGYCKT
jgi:hypothetical protein